MGEREYRRERDYNQSNESEPTPTSSGIRPQYSDASSLLSKEQLDADDRRILSRAGIDSGAVESDEVDSNPIQDFLNYVWGTAIGDWNNNSDPMQDITNMVGGVIPGVDQVLDVRDFAAHLYYMVIEKDYDSAMRWVALGLTGVGAVPIVGSVVKGLGKLALFHGGATAVARNAEPIRKCYT